MEKVSLVKESNRGPFASSPPVSVVLGRKGEYDLNRLSINFPPAFPSLREGPPRAFAPMYSQCIHGGARSVSSAAIGGARVASAVIGAVLRLGGLAG
jgi:hypothetical protein